VSEYSEGFWRRFAVLAALVYMLGLFAPWASLYYAGQSWQAALADTFTKAYGAWRSLLGTTSLALCYAIVVFTLLPPRRSALSLERLRTRLATGLFAITALHVLIYLAYRGGPPILGRFELHFGGAGYGAWVSLGSSLALLLAFGVLDAGGLGKLADRLPEWMRIDRLSVPDETESKRALSSRTLSDRRWRAVFLAALVVYLLSLLEDWWRFSLLARSPSRKGTLNLFSGASTAIGLRGIGELCALVAVAVLVLSIFAESERKPTQMQNGLVAALVCLAALNVVVV
jgi:hypothetical protein